LTPYSPYNDNNNENNKQIKSLSNEFQTFSIATVIYKYLIGVEIFAQLSLFIRGCRANVVVTNELLELNSMHGIINGEKISYVTNFWVIDKRLSFNDWFK
jgi:hypothetical protein